MTTRRGRSNGVRSRPSSRMTARCGGPAQGSRLSRHRTRTSTISLYSLWISLIWVRYSLRMGSINLLIFISQIHIIDRQNQQSRVIWRNTWYIWTIIWVSLKSISGPPRARLCIIILQKATLTLIVRRTEDQCWVKTPACKTWLNRNRPVPTSFL